MLTGLFIPRLRVVLDNFLHHNQNAKWINYFLLTIFSSKFQVWFQNRRAKYRKKENTKKGPGRPAHNAHPQSCSGEPMSNEELERKERDRREKKLMKQLEKQQKKLQAKGIHVDVDTLRKDYEAQRNGGKSTWNMEAALAAAAAQEEIDVVGGVDLDESMEEMEADQTTRLKQMEADIKKKISPFSIESLLAKRQLSVAMMHATSQAAARGQEDQENNNPPMVSPIPTSCSSPHSRASMTSPPPSGWPPRSSSPASPNSKPSLHFPIPIFANQASVAASTASNFSHELSLLKPLTASPEKPFSASFLSKISLSSTLASLQPEPPLRSPASPQDSLPGSPPVNQQSNNTQTNSLDDQSLATTTMPVEAPPAASTLSTSSPYSSSWTMYRLYVSY